LRAEDVKGLYAEAAGRLKGLTGLHGPFEPGASDDLVIHTDTISIEHGVAAVSSVSGDALIHML